MMTFPGFIENNQPSIFNRMGMISGAAEVNGDINIICLLLVNEFGYVV
jgi:hypothetical protein